MSGLLAGLGPHGTYILGSYAAMVVILLALTTAILRDHRAQKRALAVLEERGAGRRSGRNGA